MRFPHLNSPGHEKLNAIIARFGLKRTQPVRQLLIWKQSKYMIDNHVVTISSENIASRITYRLTISLDEIVHQNPLNMIPFELTKKDSGSCKFALSQSSTKMDASLRQLVSYLCVDNDTQEEKRELINGILRLLNNIISSYISIISVNIPE